jgi:hypothetical protein
MRRLIARLAVLIVSPLAAGVVMVPAAAATAAGCGSSQGYPPSPDATVQVSTTRPHVGERIKVSGVNYCPDEDVRITIGGTGVGSAHTDGNGAFDPTVTVPGPAGATQLCGIGASGLSADGDCLTLQVTASGAGNPATGVPSGGGTAFTGVEIALLGLAALVLVVGGVLITVFGRRRNAVRV